MAPTFTFRCPILQTMKPCTLLFAFVLSFLSPCLFAQSVPLDRAEILGRLAMTYSPSYIAHLVNTRGISFSSRADFVFRVKLAGGDGILLERLSSIDSSSSFISSTGADQPFDHLAKCTELIHTGAFESAGNECRASIEENPLSPWPLLVSAKLLQRHSSLGTSQESDEGRNAERAELLRRAASLAPNLALAHRALASTLAASNASRELQNASSLDAEQLEFSEVETESFGPNMSPFTNGPLEEASEPIPSSNEPITIDPGLLRRIQIEPDLASNHIALATEYYVQAHNLEKAQSEFQEAIRLEPGNAGLHTSLAFLYLSRHNAEASLSELREAVRIVPFGTFQHMVLADALETLGRTPEAITELQTTVADHPGDFEPSNALVGLYVEHKDRKSAIAELRRSLKASSLAFADQHKFVDARLQDLDRLALLLRENRELDAAAEQFLFLLRFKPNDSGFHNDYGNVLLDQRRLDEAIAEYNEALRVEPHMSTAHNNIGICLVLKKNLDGAITEFRQALELNAEEPHTQIYLGTALGQKGDLNAAMDQFQQAIAKNPKDTEAHLSLAFALDQLKDTPGAIRELKLTLELQPNSPAAQNDLAWIYATADDHKFRNPAEALVLARRAVESPQPNPAFLDTLAEALLLNGQPAEALATERQAAELDPENSELQSRLEHFREAANLHTSARP
jgi:Flp pilus assembly protein TadD